MITETSRSPGPGEGPPGEGRPGAPAGGNGSAGDGAKDGPATHPIEVELKYRMTEASTGARLIAADDLAGFTALDAAQTIRQDDRYLDTPDGSLAAAGYACRLRASDGATVITLKGLRRLDEGGPVHRREELEGPADPTLPVSSWPPSAARDAVLEIIGEQPLEDLVTLRQTRRKRSYGRDGAVVELSVDDVEVVLGNEVVERFAELELELRDGDERVLEPLVERLGEQEELVAVDASKLERALEAVRREVPAPTQQAVVGPAPRRRRPSGPTAIAVGPGLANDGAGSQDVGRQPAAGPDGRSAAPATRVSAASPTPVGMPVEAQPEPAQAEPAAREPTPAEPGSEAPPLVEEPARILVPKAPGVLADDHLAEAGRKVLRFHLARMVAREPGTREGENPEELHGMRVATRRQRAAWRVFGDAFEPRRTRRHRKRLRRVAADLGAVRDLDVLIEAAETYRKRQPRAEAEALEPLIQSWRERREVARGVLVRELDSEGYQRWLDGYLAFVQSEGQGVMTVGPTEPHRVRDAMPARVWAAYQAVRAYEPVMRWADVATLHELRIAAKWLRYTLEFVREALGRDAGPVIEKVVALQDHLGWLHDADVAAGLARAFLVEHAGDLTELESAAIGRYLVDRERELARLRRTVSPSWRGVASLAYRRALGRLVAGL